MELRDYQEKALNDLRQGFADGHLVQMLYSPTGAGKTVMAAHLIRSAVERGNPALFIVHTVTLVEQAAETFRALGLKVGIVQGVNTDVPRDWQVIVATIQTLKSRGVRWNVSVIMIDEGHILHKAHINFMERWNNKPIIGLSATPLRPDLGMYYTNMVRASSVKGLTDAGTLVPIKAYSPSFDQMQNILDTVKLVKGDYENTDLSKKLNTKELIGDLVTTWQEKAENKLTLCFAVDIAHSKSIVDDFLMAGIPAEHMDGTTPFEERSEILKRFKEGKTRILSSVNVLGIGFNAPHAEVGIIARPTLSHGLYIQYVGRLLRTYEGKDHALLLDHAGNTLRFGLPIDFIVPDLTTEANPDSKRKRHETVMVECKQCSFVMPSGTSTCPECGTDRHVRQADVEVIDGVLVEWGDTASSEVTYSPDAQMAWYRMLKYIQEERGYNDGWLYHKYIEKFAEKPPYRWKSFPALMPDASVLNWSKSQQIRYAKRQKKEKAELRKSMQKLKEEKTRQEPKDIHHSSATCSRCKGHRMKTSLTPELMHYGKMVCADCGNFITWLKTPDREKFATSKHLPNG